MTAVVVQDHRLAYCYQTPAQEPAWTVVGCVCGTSFTDRTRSGAVSRLMAHRIAAIVGSCILCDRPFAETGTDEVRRPVEYGTGHAHLGCVTDLANDLADCHPESHVRLDAEVSL